MSSYIWSTVFMYPSDRLARKKQNASQTVKLQVYISSTYIFILLYFFLAKLILLSSCFQAAFYLAFDIVANVCIVWQILTVNTYSITVCSLMKDKDNIHTYCIFCLLKKVQLYIAQYSSTMRPESRICLPFLPKLDRASFFRWLNWSHCKWRVFYSICNNLKQMFLNLRMCWLTFCAVKMVLATQRNSRNAVVVAMARPSTSTRKAPLQIVP